MPNQSDNRLPAPPGTRRHNIVFASLRPVFRLFLRLRYGCVVEPAPPLPPDAPALILSNHNAALDPFILANSFSRPIRFVASDHIFRLGLVSRLIRWLVAPIPIVKSQIDLKALRDIRSTIKAGGLVGLFPEGNRSFTGRTGPIPPATAKLVKRLDCTLLLYRLDGVYLSTPRWARSSRKGRSRGAVAEVLTAAELAGMDDRAVQERIEHALYVDAFADQRKAPVHYRGRNQAERLERVLFVCPRCKGLDTLHSRNDRLQCSCGLDVIYRRDGFFGAADDWSRLAMAEGRLHDNVAAWDDQQRRILPALLAERLKDKPSKPLFRDHRQRLMLCTRARFSHRLADGELSLYADRLVLVDKRGAAWSYAFSEIEEMVVHGPQTLQFSCRDGRIYEVRSRHPRSAYRYVAAWEALLGDPQTTEV